MKVNAILILLAALLSPTSAYINVSRQTPWRSSATSRLYDRAGGDDEGGESDNDGDSATSFARSLSERIAQVEENEASFVAGLQKRVKSVSKAEEFDSAIVNESGQSREPIMVELPVLCLDALLPNQRLAGSTTDPTFCNLLRSFGLGGMFVMTSLNNRQRKMRRFGVVARIELVDVDADDSEGEKKLFGPTAVTFIIAGKRRCEILGQPKEMKDRIGRWRRGYDPDGEESVLGWGEEQFVDKSDSMQMNKGSVSGRKLDCTEWSTNKVLIIDEESEDAGVTDDAIAKAACLIPLIERWLSLASDQKTYDNIDVVAGARRKSGEPGLSVNASSLIRRVQNDLGPMPSTECPTAFAVWGAALINPLPALGVATEIRGTLLEADGAEKKLAVLEIGLIKSLDNLDGTRPLNM